MKKTAKKEPVEEKKAEEPKKQQQAEEEDYYEDTQEMKFHRKVMYALGKLFKYSIWLATGATAYHFLLLKKFPKPEEKAPVMEPFFTIAKRMDFAFYDLNVLLTKPAMTKMLPDKMPGMVYPKTLVLNFKGTLVHQTYTYGVGVELYKRPGLSPFLFKLAQNYEIVIFGNGDGADINESADALDPKMMMIQRPCFGREQTILKDNKYIKDLSYVNRPLKDVVYVDFTDEPLAYHKENAIIIPKFEGDVDDRALMDLLPLLMHLAKHKGDVRKEIQRYGGANDCILKYSEELQKKQAFIMNQRNSGLSGMFAASKSYDGPKKLEAIGGK